ncbi:Hypothetical protein, putative [Bodo saltans]|uniref:Uncharacterized protein n=1 Tax=Bodo saltans TaxID=75058 RepID=A0A0S4J7T1_BODSA|nr:Hypothetical protein, putative [Bodo saltans]|eukprot:CUG61030.1 Hypothetical protein, putative [Bodo saltans]
MALTLRSTTSVQRSDKISMVLDKIITPGTEASQRQFKESKAAQRSEFEAYMEKETWSRMKTERDKDMVLMFGDDDVRVFKRNPSRGPAKRVGNKGALSKADLADVSGLVPVPLDRKVMRVVTSGEYVPFSQEERARIQQRRQEMALRRQQLANQYVFVSQNAQAQNQVNAHAQQLAELGIQLPKDPSRGEEPSAIPLKAWQTWIPHRVESKREADDSRAQDLRNRRRQRRHHRLNCKYHPFSTNSEMRRLAIQSSFPRSALHKSIDRVQHAANGASNGEGERFLVDGCFAQVELAPLNSNGRSQSVTMNASQTNASGFGAGAARSIRRSTQDDGSHLSTLRLVEGVQDGDLSIISASGIDHSVGGASAFLTEADTSRPPAAGRCTIPSLQLFDQPPRPHTAEGTFVDCDCTPRLTDDELDMFGIREAPDSPVDKGEGKSDGTSPRKKTSSEKTLLGSAARAEKRLDLWHRDFALVSVHAGSGLQSLLAEREENRAYVINEREHLNIVVHEAELSGADFRVSRRHRCTTPQRASMWTPVFEAIADDARHVVSNATAFASLIDFCEEHRFPAHPWEQAMLEEIREKCVGNASVRQSRTMTTSPTRNDKKTHRKSEGISQRSGSVASEGRRPSSVNVSAPLAAVAHPNSTERSVFVALQRGKGGASPLPAKSGSKSNQHHENALDEGFAMHLLEKYGPKLVQSKKGLEIANYVREQCGVSNKAFLAFLFSKETSWDMCQDVHNLQKRLAAK